MVPSLRQELCPLTPRTDLHTAQLSIYGLRAPEARGSRANITAVFNDV